MTRTETCHKHDGTPQGGFALFVSNCRSLVPAIASGLAVGSLEETIFHLVDYSNYSGDRTLPLFRCRLFDSVIRGMFLHLSWVDVECTKLDLAHTRGTADWKKVIFRRCNVNRLMSRVHATDSTFERTRFRESVLEDCVFERCIFSRCDLLGSRFRRASFIDCHFDDVDVSETLWWDPKVIQISGTWHGAPIPLPNGGSAKA